MATPTRSIRRHHRARLINKVSHYFIVQHRGSTPKKLAALVFNNTSVCSCMMCCNERRNGWNSNRMKLTIQERKAEDNYLDYLNDK